MAYRVVFACMILGFGTVWLGCKADSDSSKQADVNFERQFLDDGRSREDRLRAGMALTDSQAGQAFLVAQYWTPRRGLVQSLVDSLIVTQPKQAAQLLAALMATAGGEAKLHFESRLITLGEPAVEALVALAEGNIDWQTAMRVLDALGKLGARQGIDVMRAHLSHRNDWVRIAAAHALGEVGGEEALSALAEGLRDTSDTVVAAALVGLGKIGDRRAVSVCAKKLKHPNARVRAAAVSALGRMGGTGVRELLQPMLKDSDDGVRFKTRQALELMNRIAP